MRPRQTFSSQQHCIFGSETWKEWGLEQCKLSQLSSPAASVSCFDVSELQHTSRLESIRYWQVLQWGMKFLDWGQIVMRGWNWKHGLNLGQLNIQSVNISVKFDWVVKTWKHLSYRKSWSIKNTTWNSGRILFLTEKDVIEGAEVVFEVRLLLPFPPEEGAHLVEVQAQVFVMMQLQAVWAMGSFLIIE